MDQDLFHFPFFSKAKASSLTADGRPQIADCAKPTLFARFNVGRRLLKNAQIQGARNPEE
jgi:hypothetical protein